MQRGSILAIDLASKTGLAEGRPGEKPRLRTIEFAPGGDVFDFYGALTAWMATKLRDNPPDLIAIEEPIAPSAIKGHTSHDTTMKTIGGFAIIVGIIKCKNIPFEPVRVATWRKHFIGSGVLASIDDRDARRKEGKRMVIHRCRLLGWAPEDDNQADAAGIWDWAGATCMNSLPEKLHLFGEKGGPNYAER